MRFIHTTAALMTLGLAACSGGEDRLTEEPTHWQSRTALRDGRAYVATTKMDGAVYVAGGVRDGVALPTVDTYDPTTAQWRQLPDMPTPRAQAALVAHGGRLFVIGGDNGGPVATVEIYDPADDAWTTGEPLPNPRFGHAAVVYGERIWVLGGATDRINASNVYSYDPTADEWREEVPLGDTQGPGIAAVVFDETIWVLGGFDDSVARCSALTQIKQCGALFSVESWVPDEQRWQLRAPLPTARHEHAVSVLDGSLYVFGGYDTRVRDEVERFDLEEGRWIVEEPLPSPRAGTAAASLDGEILVIGGFGLNAPAMSRVDAFVP